MRGNKSKSYIKLFLTFFFIFNLYNINLSEIIVSSENNDSISRDKNLINIDELPSYFCWWDYNDVDYTTPVKKQFGNSCEAFSLLAALETMVQYNVSYPFDCDLSESYLFLASGGSIWGTYIEDAADFLVEHGVPDESFCPTEEYYWNNLCNMTYDKLINRSVKIKEWGYTDETINDIKKHLIEDSPIITYIHLYNDLVYFYNRPFKNSFPVYRHRFGGSYGPHYVTIIGYNDSEESWICKNSFGDSWGHNGYFKIKYGECGIEKHSIYLKKVSGHYPIKFVDDNNKNGPWLGTKKFPYNSIQTTIENSSDGYTIYVSKGNYNENIIINKSIILKGEDCKNTIISGKGKGSVILVKNKNVKIHNFTIKNSGSNKYDSGVELRYYGALNTSISNNIIQNNNIGIYLYTSYKCEINNNHIYNNKDDGIHLFFSINEENNIPTVIPLLSKIRYNLLSHEKISIKIINILIEVKQFWEKIRIYKNNFFINNDYNNIIKNNTIEYNKQDAIELEYSRRCLIKNNNINNNSKNGLYLNDRSNRNTIYDNNINNNQIGINLSESKGNIIRYNDFIGNKDKNIFYKSFFNIFINNYWKIFD